MRSAAVLTSAMLVMVTLFYGLALKVTGLDERIYYRPDEELRAFRLHLQPPACTHRTSHLDDQPCRTATCAP
ncbi:MAG: hypothetical protein MZV65_19005 [Chromatiales bacterium]|nr:hypothetical protein [Chromatiales bacterium]